MSVMLPNGNWVAPATMEGLQEIARKIKAGEPIIVASTHADGTVTEEVLWDPSDPVAPWLLNPPPSQHRRSKLPWLKVGLGLAVVVASLAGLTWLLL